jgi:hypothetical protein
MINLDEKFKAALIEATKKRGVQAQIAKVSGLGATYINNIIKGRNYGSEEVKRKIAAALRF